MRVHRRALTGAAAVLGLLVPGVALIVFIGAVLVGVNAVSAFLDESAVPPISRLPDLPDGAVITNQEQPCGSGGCSWSIRITPPPGQTASDLAATMGVEEEQRFPGTLFYLRAVSLGSDVIEDELRVYLGYEQVFP